MISPAAGTAAHDILVYLPKGENDFTLQATAASTLRGGKIVGEETVGPTVGKELKKSAIISIILSLFLIVLYIWFRFGRNGLGYGFDAVIALTHDPIVTIGFFRLMDFQVGLDFVAANLTIVGYSVNDTIFIFDRVREPVNKGGKASFSAIASQCNNETFSRTIDISFIVLASVIVLAIFGGSSMRDMNVALIIGVIAGGYSTVALACHFVVWWDRRRLRVNPAAKA